MVGGVGGRSRSGIRWEYICKSYLGTGKVQIFNSKRDLTTGTTYLENVGDLSSLEVIKSYFWIFLKGVLRNLWSALCRRLN